MRIVASHAVVRGLIATALALGTAGGACRSAQSGPSDSDEGPAPRPRTTVRVENQRFQDMDVYVVYQTQRVHLGMVTGNSAAVFVIPPSFLTEVTQLRFLALAVGGADEPVSDEVTVRPGDEVGMTIAPY